MTKSYRDAGVDIDEARRAVDLIARAAATTATPSVLGGVGGFGSLFRFDPTTHPAPVLVASTDGVGTKLKVAIALGRHDTIGVDLVNHCINDIAVQGADPLFFLDYLAVGRLRAELVDGSSVRAGDTLIGIPSSGLHTNGYSLARRILPPDEWQLTAPGLAGTIGEALLEPHRSYLDEISILRRRAARAG